MSSSFVGKVLDNYRIIENLGIGGMGVVFKAIHIKLDKIFALKMIAPGMTMNENFIKRFQTEAKALAKFEDPNIVRIYDIRSDNDHWFIVMEYVDGINLLDKIKKDGPFKWQDALPILKQMLKAIGHAHTAGIIHRDIKPNNVMMTKKGIIKITDFGLAKDQSNAGSTLTVTSGGTLYYMSPEHIRGFSYTDKRSDIYSTGMTFYEMITGNIPYKKINSDFDIRESIIRKEIEKPSSINPDIPLELESIVMKSIAKNPDDRYQTTDEMLQAIYEFEKNENILDSSEVPPLAQENLKTKTTSKLLEKRYYQKIALTIGVISILLILYYTFYGIFSSPSIDEKELDNISKLSISSSPLVSAVFLNGDFIGNTPISNYSLQEGQYSLRVIKEDFLPFDTTISLKNGNNMDLAFSLIKKENLTKSIKTIEKPVKIEKRSISSSSSVSFHSEPLNAEIWLNRSYKGNTPLSLKSLKPGDYQIKIRKNGYQEYIKNIKLTSKSDQIIYAKLIPFTGGITITSDPSSARVKINGKEVPNQLTPIEMDNIPIGKHQIEIFKAGYFPVNKEIEIKSNEVYDFHTTLQQQKGRLSIQVKPWGSIHINERLYKASTDLKYEIELPVDEYKITVVHPTLGKWEKVIQIESNLSKEVAVDFNRNIPLNITAFDEAGNPLFADIYVDNQNTGKMTPEEINIRVGVHKLSVKKEGYTSDSEEKEILIDTDSNESQTFILKRNR